MLAGPALARAKARRGAQALTAVAFAAGELRSPQAHPLSIPACAGKSSNCKAGSYLFPAISTPASSALIPVRESELALTYRATPAILTILDALCPLINLCEVAAF